MSNGVQVLERISETIKADPDTIDQIFVDKFDLSELVNGAANIGYDMTEEDIEDYLAVKFPSPTSEIESKFYIQNPESGELRELTDDEMDAVSGGACSLAVACVFVYAGAVVYVGAALAAVVLVLAAASAGVATVTYVYE